MNDQIKNKSLLQSTFDFFKKPYYLDKGLDLKWHQKFFNLIKLFSLEIFFLIPLVIIVELLARKIGFSESDNAIFDLFSNYPAYLVLLLAVLYAPISEELTFRMFLRFSYSRLGFAVSFLFYILLSICERVFSLDTVSVLGLQSLLNYKYLPSVIFIAFFLVLGILFSFLFKKIIDKEKAISFYKKYFPILFYISVFAFGFAHILNYENIGSDWYILLIFVLPQTLVGMFLGYVRTHYGLFWSMLNHAIYNAALAIPVIFFINLDINNLNTHDAIKMGVFFFAGLVITFILLSSLIYVFAEHFSKRKRIL